MENAATINSTVTEGGTISSTVTTGSTIQSTLTGGGVGPQGPIGDTGPIGPTGTPGAKWYEGAIAPSTLYNNGDFYLNTTTGDVYEQVALAWGSPIGNIIGPVGVGTVNNFNLIHVDQSPNSGTTYGAIAGSVNGTNTVFTVSQSQYVSGSLRVSLNGQELTQGSGSDWVETTPASGTFTFEVAPPTGSIIQATYVKSATSTTPFVESVTAGTNATVNNTDPANPIVSGPPTATFTTSGIVEQTVYNVMAYGATGNGSTNDTSSFNTALTAASGATLYIPPGTYMLTPGTLENVPSGTKIQGAGIGTAILKCASGFNGNNNLIQIVSVTNVEICDLTIDGNKSNNTNYQYGLFISASTNCSAHNLQVQNWNGDGVQLYDSTGCMVSHVWSTGNVYHGFEVEQCTNCTLSECRGYSNTIHGLFLSPGEVGSLGSLGNTIIGCSFDSNSEYGFCVNWDNGSTGNQLSMGNKLIGCSITGNSQYGICLYGESRTIIEGCYVYNNGYFGLYGYQSAYNIITGNLFRNNSQASNGAYDEIYFEGYSAGFAAAGNNISSNTIIIEASNKARYAINEGTSSDGPNTIVNNVIPTAGTSGKINSLCVTDILSDPAGVHQVYGTQAIQGANGGIDNAFSDVLRLYNNMGGQTQIVNPNSSANFWIGGNDVADVTSAGIQVNSGYGFKLATSPTSGYVLTSDSSGNGTWQANADSVMTTLGDTIYQNATPAAARLAGNTTTTKKYLSQTGTGSISAVPAWAQIAAADLSNGTTGTGNIVLATSPTLTTPTLGVATATSVNGLTLTSESTGFQVAGGSTSKTLAISNSLTLAGTDSTTMTFPSSSATIAGLAIAQTWSAAQTFNSGDLLATSPKITTQISDVNGNPIITFTPTASAIGGIGITNNVSGGSITISNANTGNSGTIFTGAGTGLMTFQPGSDSVIAWAVQNAAHSSYALSVDTSNLRIGIGLTSPTASVHTSASTASAASLRIPSGTAPTSPNAGDIWNDGSNLNFYNGSVTQTFLPNAGGTLTGTLTSSTVAPSANNTYNLGSTSDYWQYIYGSRLYLNSTAYLDGGTAGVITLSTNAGDSIYFTNHYSSGGVSVFDAFAPNIPNNNVSKFRIGVAASTYNSAEFNFNYVSAGSSSNNFSFGLYGFASILSLTSTAVTVSANLTMSDAKNIVLGTTTGTNIGTATSQKLSFWNKTPIIQPTTGIAAATFAANTSGTLNDSATWGGYTIGQVVQALQNVGILA